MGERKFCYRCMEKYEMEMHTCPHCGFNDTSPYNPKYIEPGTLINDRYMVGVMLSQNGEGATYVGYDTSTDCKVMIREYMPANFCTRVKNTSTISVNYNNLAKYKAFMNEFTELHKSLARLRNNSNINPVHDMFSENNTTYIVFEYLDGKKMIDYLKDNAGELSWEQVSKLFPQLFTTIGILHNAGIIHRAISPSTVYINSKGELKLSGFCVSALRTADAGLEHELFKGYAAPEQYSANSSSRQGSWTDIYGICALLYRALTGCMPSDALSRMKSDDLCEPAMLNKRIPANVSRTIMDGMKLDISERIQTVTELVTRLFEQPATQRTTVIPMEQPKQPQQPPVNSGQGYQQQYYGGYNAYYGQQQTAPPPRNPDNRRQRQDDYDDYHYEKVSTVDRLKVPVIITILLLAILIIIAVFIMRVFVPKNSSDTSSSRNSSSLSENIVSDSNDEESTTEPMPDTEMPNLVGKFFSYTEVKYEGFFTFEATFVYTDDYEADIIMEQDIEEGAMVAQGSVVHLVVSKGKTGADIPAYSGLTVSQYENSLKAAGISNYSLIESSNTWGTPNTVTQLQVDGKEVKPGEYFSNEDDKKLIVYYISENAEVQTYPVEYSTTQYVESTTDISSYTTTAYVTTTYTTTVIVTTTEPPVVATDPPVTEPPVVITDPPVTEPPVVITDPPVTEPPVVEPPQGGENVEEW